MIKDITTASSSVVVTSTTHRSIYNAGQSAGQMRYNTNTQNYEVYDGGSWVTVSQIASVSLTWEAEKAISWAKTKMVEEASLKERMDQHPGLKDAWDKFQIMDILTKEVDNDEQPA